MSTDQDPQPSQPGPCPRCGRWLKSGRRRNGRCPARRRRRHHRGKDRQWRRGLERPVAAQAPMDWTPDGAAIEQGDER